MIASINIAPNTVEYGNQCHYVLDDMYWGEMANIAVNMESVSREDIDKLLERLV